MPDAESFRDGIRQLAVFNHQNGAADKAARAFDKVRKLFVDVRADRTLRAMLENQYRIGFGPIEELLEITILS